MSLYLPVFEAVSRTACSRMNHLCTLEMTLALAITGRRSSPVRRCVLNTTGRCAHQICLIIASLPLGLCSKKLLQARKFWCTRWFLELSIIRTCDALKKTFGCSEC